MDTLKRSRGGSALSRSVVKAMGVFGGVQVVNILCAALRAKIFAVFAGPAAVGVMSLFTQGTATISAATQLNFNQSGVRDVSSASPSELPAVVAVIRRWALWLGLLGVLVTLLLSPALSFISFGSLSFTAGFAVISVTLLLGSLSGARQAVLQGTGAFRSLATASVRGYLSATVISVALVLWLGVDAVIPVIITIFITQWAALLMSGNPVPPPAVRLSARECFRRGRPFIVLGAYMTVSSVVTLALNYAFTAWLSNTASAATVGVYQAGYTIVNAYIGMIFNSIVMEYYPRLTRNISQPRRSSVLVSHEISLVLWVLVPALCLFAGCGHLLVRLLYSSKFDECIPFITIASAGVVPRAVSWCMAYTMLARGDGKAYVVTEVISGLAGLALNIVFFRCHGYAGLGLSYIIWYALYTLIVGCVYRFRYGMTLGRGVASLCVCGFLLVAVCVAASLLFGPVFAVAAGLVSGVLAVKRLKEKMFVTEV